MKKPLVLAILDGFGLGGDVGNAIKEAPTSNLDKIFKENAFTKLGASGLDVGLPIGQMGNSEVGHTNIGAGRVVYQELTRISKEIQEGQFFENRALVKAMDKAIKGKKGLHLIGLLSDGGVHSHIEHLYALVEMAKARGLDKVYIHAFLDGRDTAPDSGLKFVKCCREKLLELGLGKIAMVMGRYYAMDRDNRWERVKKAYDAMVHGEGEYINDPVEAVERSYKSAVMDEFIEPVICAKEGVISQGDSVIFFNFRPDRAREITRCLVDDKFNEFDRRGNLLDLSFVCMTQYDQTMPGVEVAFFPQSLSNTLGEYIAKRGLTQLRIAETEKYAHVTFFFNGGVEQNYEGEDRIIVASPKIATYDLQPEMSAYEVTEKVESSIKSGQYDVIILNFANCDMVGHTGVFEATAKAVSVVDTCIGRVVDCVRAVNGVAIITADHGNADQMLDEAKGPFTAHTVNPVPFCVVGYECRLASGGRLSDIAPTILEILGIDQPVEMTGVSLIKR